LAITRAIEIEPNLAAAYSILGWIRLYCDWDWTGAEVSVRRALELAPNSFGVLLNAMIVLGNVDCRDEAAALGRRAAVLDPLNASAQRQVAWVELDAMDFSAAEASLVRSLELDPRLALTNFALGLLRLAQSRMDEALAAFQNEEMEDYRLVGVTLAQHLRGDPIASLAALKTLVERYSETSPCQVAAAYACRSEVGPAFGWLDRAFAKRDPRLVEIRHDATLRNLHHDPRWPVFLHRMGFPAR